ncbi:MAG: peptide chain release factor N(5)-glutamine methyltransferase [Betaproteobacteria bacterium HGW-Betaproteobacteria-11]|nr:MAG: peptide chain release factor N(5)-glutamine methyltransferase [Betaproteobacteria bacterium HGW-Betaproteobacteria-11]
MPTLAETLAATRGRLPMSEARLLLAQVLARPIVWLLAHDDDVLTGAAREDFLALVARREAGEPLAYLLGRREFHGREFTVSPAVLIPRPETELLVERSLAGLATGQKVSAGNTPKILDLGTGSGCIALTLALECPRAWVTAVDASPQAIAVAQDNARRLGANVRFLLSDWFAALEGERFDLVVGNPPYIAAEDPHLAQGDLRHEPRSALASGEDGLAAIRRIIEEAPAHLEPGGYLWLEHGFDQAPAVRRLLETAGFVAIEQHPDLAGILRVSGGRSDPGSTE